MSKDPAFLFYPNDYLGGTMGFSIDQHGLYILALVFQFNNGHFSESQINGVLNNRFNEIKHKFKTDGKTFWNSRLDFEKERRSNFVQSRRDSIDKRWNKNDKPLSGKRLSNIRMDVHTGIRMENENEDENKVSLDTSLFTSFWKLYPKKTGKGAAEKSWDKIKEPTKTLELITVALTWQAKSHEWTKDNGQFIPMPATYLNQRRWEDEEIKKEEKESNIEKWKRDRGIE